MDLWLSGRDAVCVVSVGLVILKTSATANTY